MGEILPFKRPKKAGKGLCQHGFHQWKIRQDKQFDVRRGQLITVYRCARCGEEKTVAK